MKILGIESSCDETAAAVVEDGTKVIASAVASSLELHAKTGGIIPEEAARQQIKSILPVLEETLEACTIENIDAIAVTVGPGLIGSLVVGVETAKTLSLLWNKPIIPINHLVGHIYANWLDLQKEIPMFPALALVVSGGHTDLVVMNSHSDITWIGGTRDDAAGEAFDKTARLLGLSYPGGPSISREAEEYIKSAGENLEMKLFPRPMINDNTFDFSFSGLKTAAQNVIQTPHEQSIQCLAAEIQESIVDVLVTKTMKAVEKYKPKSLLLAGGVTANKRLREKFQQEAGKDISLYIPEFKYCTDNAAYIAAAAYFHQTPIAWQNLSTNPELTITDFQF